MNKLYFGTIRCNDVDIHYTHTSQGFPPVVMLHGLFGNGLTWNRLAMAINHVFDVYLPDARGHGLSECPPEGHTLDELTRDAAEFIRNLNLEPAIVIGHSMGAATAAKLSADFPDLVSAMILIDPPWYPAYMMTEEFGEKASADFIDTLQRYQKMSYEELAAEARRIHPNWAEDDIRPWVKSEQQMNPAFLDGITTIPINWEAIADRVSKPCLIMTGNNDLGAIVTPETLKTMLERHPNWDATYYESSGHNIQRDDFKRTRTDVLRYLRRLTLGY